VWHRELENPFLIQVARLYAITLNAFDSARREKQTSDFNELWQLSPISKVCHTPPCLFSIAAPSAKHEALAFAAITPHQFASSYDVVPLFESSGMAEAKEFVYEGRGGASLS
jgi:hypothetical protein